MRPVKRNLVTGVSALLIIFQVLVVPIAQALTDGLGCTGCDETGTVATSHTDHACGDHSAAPDGATDGSQQHHSGTVGHCHCVHGSTFGQALATSMTIVRLPVQAESLAGEPKGPAFSAPLFEFLRPPK